MNKEINISNVPFTPRGENHDFKSVINYEFVRFDEEIKVRTTSLIFSDSFVSDNEIDINSLEDVEEKVNAIIKSPMIEVRKKRNSSTASYTNDGEIRLNPLREDFLETSAGCYKNYAIGRRKTIAIMNQYSSAANDRRTRNKSLPNADCPPIEQVINENKENLTVENTIDLLVTAVCDARAVLDVESKRLSDLMTDWEHILKMENGDIPQENQDEIRSVVGRLKILMDNRFKSTGELLTLAEVFVNNEGVIVNEGEKEYLPNDIYAFVDVLIHEIKKISTEFKNLLDQRDNNWVEVVVKKVQPVTVVKKRKPVAKKAVQSRIDISSLRRKYRANSRSSRCSISLRSNRASVTDADLIDDSANKKTPVSSIKRGVRSKAVIKTLTGTPLHSDTPRPRKFSKRRSSNQFAVPNINVVVPKKKSTSKRSITQASFAAHSDFQSPTFLSKVSRRSSREKKK